MEMTQLLIVVQKKQTYLEIFLFRIWTAVLMSHDEVELFCSPLETKQDIILHTFEIKILKSANSSTSHLRTKTEKTWELIMFILLN